MKIALITIHYGTNYGAVLQAFATKKILSRYGEVETINYGNPRLQYKSNLIRFEPSIQGIKMMIHDILRLKDRNKVVNQFKKFIESNLNMNSSKLVTRQDIQTGAINDFDVYVCGSDQIWNPNVISKDGELDPIYFLNFANKLAKKISYASSMGGYRFRDSKKAKIKDLLKDFTTISVRESDDQEMLSQLLEREVFHVLDPTLLLSKEEWFEILKIDKNYRSQKEDYILVYVVQKTPLLKKVVKFVVNKLGNKKVVIIDQAFKPFINTNLHIRDAGPLEFIELFANARFIITDSFHGVCFSINFKNPFVAVRPAWLGVNRIESLLNLLGLKNKLLNDEKDIDKLSVDFNYESLEEQLQEERAKSIKVLSSSIVS
jgi:hypothetical protein